MLYLAESVDINTPRLRHVTAGSSLRTYWIGSAQGSTAADLARGIFICPSTAHTGEHDWPFQVNIVNESRFCFSFFFFFFSSITTRHHLAQIS